MKKFLILSLSILFGSLSYAQVSAKKFNMSNGEKPALVIDLKDTEKKEIEKAWEKFTKDFKAKTKKDKKTNEIFSDDATLEGVSENTVDVYATVVETGNDTQLRVWFDLGGTYLSKADHPDRYPAAEKVLNDFSLSVAKTMVEDLLKEEEKVLKDREKEMKKLEKEMGSYEDEIAKCEKKIEEAKANIEQNKIDQQNKTAEIEAQIKVVKEVDKKLKDF